MAKLKTHIIFNGQKLYEHLSPYIDVFKRPVLIKKDQTNYLSVPYYAFSPYGLLVIENPGDELIETLKPEKCSVNEDLQFDARFFRENAYLVVFDIYPKQQLEEIRTYKNTSLYELLCAGTTDTILSSMSILEEADDGSFKCVGIVYAKDEEDIIEIFDETENSLIIGVRDEIIIPVTMKIKLIKEIFF